MTTTMKAKWTVEDNGRDSGNLIRAQIVCGEKVICEVPDSAVDFANDDPGSHAAKRRAWKEDEQTIQLLKAAPDLLEACKAALLALEPHACHRRVYDALDAAIRKATGE